MKISEDVISSLKGKDVSVKGVHTCVFWTAVESKHCGLSSTFRERVLLMSEGSGMWAV